MADGGLLIPSLIGGATALLGFGQAAQQNANIRSAQEANMAATNRAIGVQQTQLSDQASQQAKELSQEAHLMEGRLRVAAGESGLGMGGTASRAAYQLQSNLDENLGILDTNYNNQVAALQSQSVAPTKQTVDPSWSALSGGISGFFGGANAQSAFDF